MEASDSTSVVYVSDSDVREPEEGDQHTQIENNSLTEEHEESSNHEVIKIYSETSEHNEEEGTHFNEYYFGIL